MATLLVIVLLTMAFLVALVVGGVLLTTRSMTRRNRINPSVASQAPTGWLWSVGMAARCHRRLQRVAFSARASKAAAGPTGSTVADLATDLERQACALDDQLVLASHLATTQRLRRVYELDRAVSELEHLAVRVTVLAGHFGANAPAAAEPLGERIGMIEAAVAEIQGIERAARGEVDALGPPLQLPVASQAWGLPHQQPKARVRRR